MGQGNKWGENMIFKNFLFVDNTLAIDSFDWTMADLNYANFWNNQDNGDVEGTNLMYVNPGFDVFNGKTNYMYIPDDSPLKGAGENGKDIGANIVYRYENGVLTDVPLWPWPMNDRILQEMNFDVTETFYPGL